MLIFFAIAIVAIALAVTTAVPATELRRHRFRSRSLRGPQRQGQADWWPDFERQFWAYVRDHEHETH